MEEEGFARVAAMGWRGTGQTVVSLTLQSYDDRTVVVDSCVDVSGTDLLDAAGVSVVKAGRAAKVSFEVTFDDDMRIIENKLSLDSGIC